MVDRGGLWIYTNFSFGTSGVILPQNIATTAMIVVGGSQNLILDQDELLGPLLGINNTKVSRLVDWTL